MITYWLLLLPTALIAYTMGSLSTLVLASNFVFRRNLRKLGSGNDFLSNFKRVYGMKGALKLLAVEVVKDVIPIILGGILLGTKGHSDAGKAFAAFCLVLGRLFPVYYGFRGSHAAAPLIVSALILSPSLGIVSAIFILGVLLATKYISLASVIGALLTAAASVLIVEDNLIVTLVALTAALVIVKHIPALRRIIKGQETKYSFREDLTYKFDEGF